MARTGQQTWAIGFPVLLTILSYAVFAMFREQTAVIYAVELVPPAVGAVWMIRACRSPHVPNLFFWKTMTASTILYLLCLAIMNVNLWVTGEPFDLHSLGDALWMAPTLCLGVALFSLIGSFTGKSRMFRFWLDVLIVAVALAVVCYEYWMKPGLAMLREGDSRIAFLCASFYPVVIVLMLVCLYVIQFFYRRLFSTESLLLLTAGFVLYFISNTGYVYMITLHMYTPGSWVDPLWGLAGMLHSAAAVRAAGRSQPETPGETVDYPESPLIRLVFPYLCVAALGVLLVREAGEVNSMIIGCAAIMALVLTRQAAILLENEELQSSHRKMAHRTEFLASFDELTRLPNRKSFERIVEREIAADSRELPLVVLLLDLDRFKYINETLGHGFGDSLLRDVAERLTETAGTHRVARLGGDEFAIVITVMTSTEQLQHLAQSIVRAVARPFLLNRREIRISTSIGIAVYPQDGRTAAELMKNADAAMYKAKESGGDRFHLYTDGLNSGLFRKIEIETSLRRALENEQFMLVYQPQVDVKTGLLRGVEALVRWQRDNREMVSPGEFIPLAEETGLIVPLGEWVLRTACQQAVAWQAQGMPPLKMAVNVSPKQLLDEQFVGKVKLIIAQTGMPAGNLVLEITESAAIRDVERTVANLGLLKEMGIRIAMDDFGTGYSSLGYLSLFQVDTLKIAQEFIRQIADREGHAPIVRAIIAMAHSLGLAVIAEGVETREAYELLESLSCDVIQGYYFGKPLSVAEFERRYYRETSGDSAAENGLQSNA